MAFQRSAAARNRRNRFGGGSAPPARTNGRVPQKVQPRDVLSRITYVSLQILTIPVKAFEFLTQPPGSAIVFALFTAVLFLVNIEGYWQASGIGSGIEKPSFVPKPFVEDGANPINFFIAIADPTFYIAALFSIAIQALQAKAWREVSIEAAQAALDAVKDLEVPDVKERAPHIARVRQQALMNAGMKAVRRRGMSLFLAYAIDIIIALYNFPWFGLRAAFQFFVNLVWGAGSVVGAEWSLNHFIEAMEEGNPFKQPPKVEVLPPTDANQNN